MKRITFIITFSIISLLTFAQSSLSNGAKSEYKYFGIKTGLVNNFSLPIENNNFVLIKSPRGDMMKKHKIAPFTYTPGGNFSVIYNFDFKSNKSGIVFGLDFSNFGFSNSYKSDTLGYTVNEHFRTSAISIPIFYKFGTKNIYKDQFYATVGIKYNIFLMTQTFQKASWNGQMYIGNIVKGASRTSSFSLTAGLNYKIYFFNVELLPSNFIDKDYTTTIAEGTIRPYNHINITNSVFITTGVNIPLTRWLTARNWTAEKVRRFFKGSM